MNFDESLTQLRDWCDQSVGEPIQGLLPGRNVFLSRSRHDDQEIHEMEICLGCSLPESYFRFMATIGASSLFSTTQHGGGPLFYNPQEVIRASTSAVVGNDRLCFVGEHRSMGDFMGFLVSRDGPKNFDVFCHEYPFEEYVSISDEINSWRTFECWLIHAVETRGLESI